MKDELVGLVREASDTSSKASTVNPTTSIAVQTDGPARPRLVPYIGGWKTAPTQLRAETTLTLVPRVGEIEITPSKPEIDGRRLLVAPDVGRTETARDLSQVEEEPAFVPHVGREVIVPAQKTSKLFSPSNLASDLRNRRSNTGVAGPGPRSGVGAAAWDLVSRYALGSGLCPRDAIIRPAEPSNPKNPFKENV